jgi:hypothetical protein
MMKTSTTILVFGIYVLVIGLILIFVPNILLGLFMLPAANEVWVRVLGILAVALSTYYLQAYRDMNTDFFLMTIRGRVIFAISIIVLALMTPNHLPLIGFALVDLLGAAWTWYASQQEMKARA